MIEPRFDHRVIEKPSPEVRTSAELKAEKGRAQAAYSRRYYARNAEQILAKKRVRYAEKKGEELRAERKRQRQVKEWERQRAAERRGGGE